MRSYISETQTFTSNQRQRVMVRVGLRVASDQLWLVGWTKQSFSGYIGYNMSFFLMVVTFDRDKHQRRLHQGEKKG